MKRKQQNNEFSGNEKAFYQKLDNVPHDSHLVIANMKQYWEKVWTARESYNKRSIWIKEEQKDTQFLQKLAFIRRTKRRIKVAVSNIQNVKATGLDEIYNMKHSLFLGLQGPSYLLDTACSSSMYALDNAFNGEMDAKIIAGANLCLLSVVTLQFVRKRIQNYHFQLPVEDLVCWLMMVMENLLIRLHRSKAINCLFLQGKRDAKRVYDSVV
ncbi:hypothetical protein GQX74_000149 [Glossina fuscipes]|nr:hypothetical protein GQX74_000149 [Glossina fuscipes]